MITGRLAPRACRRLVLSQQHALRTVSRRCLATDVQSNEAALEAQFRQAASGVSGGRTQSADGTLESPPQPAPRPRRRKDAVQPRDPIVDDYLAYQHMQKTTAPYGSDFQPGYEPHTLLSNPPSPKDVTLELLMASQTHMGHSTSLWNPANSRYIFGVREGIHIISLDVTAQYLRRAAKVVSGVAERGGLILFVGTRAGFSGAVVRAAQLASPAYHLFERWTPGSITNAQQILGKGVMRVVDEFDTEVDGFTEQLNERAALRPDLVVCLNPLENYVLLHECALATIPTIGIIDTDADPTHVTYPIPANDDSIRSIQVIAGVLGRAGQEGQLRRRQAALGGNITYNPPEQLTLPEDFDRDDFKASREAKRRAFQSGLADMELLADPTLGAALSKLTGQQKRMLEDRDETLFSNIDSSMNPRERATLRRHFNAKMLAASRSNNPTPLSIGSGDNAKALDMAAASTTHPPPGALSAESSPQSEAEDMNSYEANELEGDDRDALALSPVEAQRRAAAEAYFAENGGTPRRRRVSEDGEEDEEEEQGVPAGARAAESEAFINILRHKLSPSELEALQQGPTDEELASIQTRLEAGEFETLISALEAAREREADAAGYDNGEGYEAGGEGYDGEESMGETYEEDPRREEHEAEDLDNMEEEDLERPGPSRRR